MPQMQQRDMIPVRPRIVIPGGGGYHGTCFVAVREKTLTVADYGSGFSPSRASHLPQSPPPPPPRHSRVRGNPGVRSGLDGVTKKRLAASPDGPWIPAFAGMTIGGGGGDAAISEAREWNARRRSLLRRGRIRERQRRRWRHLRRRREATPDFLRYTVQRAGWPPCRRHCRC